MAHNLEPLLHTLMISRLSLRNRLTVKIPGHPTHLEKQPFRIRKPQPMSENFTYRAGLYTNKTP